MVEECMFWIAVDLRDYQRILIIMDPIDCATYWSKIFKKKWRRDEITFGKR